MEFATTKRHGKTYLSSAKHLAFGMAAVFSLAVSVPANAAEPVKISVDSEHQQVMGLKAVAVEKVSQFPVSSILAEVIYGLDKQHQISAPLDGKLVGLYHIHGEVEKGQVIVELQSPQWVEMQSELLNTQVELRAAQQELKRAKALSQSGAASAKRLNQASANLAKWQSLKTMQVVVLQRLGMTGSQIDALLKQQKIDTGNMQLRAEVAGQFYDLKVKIGEEVAKGQALGALSEDDVMVLDAPVPTDIVKNLQEGQAVFLPELNRMAQISHIHNQVNPTTQSVDVHVRVDNPDRTIKAGKMMPVQFLQPLKNGGFKAPATALSVLDGERVVYVQNGPEIQAAKVEVQTIQDGVMYFIMADQSMAEPKQVFIQGTAAIKAAFSADEAE